jgi:hypothetical protein
MDDAIPQMKVAPIANTAMCPPGPREQCEYIGLHAIADLEIFVLLLLL